MNIQVAYNNPSVSLAGTQTTVPILGTLVTDCGKSINTTSSGFQILNSGVYRISFDITATATTAGTLSVGLSNGSTALPCATASESLTQGGTGTSHIETILPIGSCCVVRPFISAYVSGITGTLDHVCASCEKLS